MDCEFRLKEEKGTPPFFVEECETPTTEVIDADKRKQFERWVKSGATALEQNDFVADVVALGQHYGLPTRLLDWSESPYIAAFFAFSDALGQVGSKTLREIRADAAEVAIWSIVNTRKWHEHKLHIWEPSAKGNYRLYAQKGYHTELRAHQVRPLEKLFVETGTPEVRKFCIPVSEVAEAMDDLRLMGIDPAKLYGELVGQARSALNRAVLLHLSEPS